MLATHALVITRVEWSVSGTGRASSASVSSGERLPNWIPPHIVSFFLFTIFPLYNICSLFLRDPTPSNIERSNSFSKILDFRRWFVPRRS